MLIALAAAIGLVFIILDAPGILAPDRSASITDAIFLAISATTLTGLSVSDTSRQLSPLGFGVLAIIIQLAGWFWITTASWLVFRVLSQVDAQTKPPTWGWLLGRVVKLSLIVQALAALAMIPLWRGDLDILHRVGLSVFHAVAAWNNAGFSPLADKLADYRDSPLVYLVIGPLSVAGMIGYPGWRVMREWIVTKPRVAAMAERDENSSVRTATGNERIGNDNVGAGTAAFVRTGLSAMAIVYLLGTVAITVSQTSPYFFAAFKQGMEMRRGDEEGLTLRRAGRITGEASYIASSARVSGLVAQPIDTLRAPGRVAAMALMLAGGVPGGTAGCVGAAALTMLARCGVARRGVVATAWKRWASGVIVFYAVVLITGVYLLALSEPYPFLDLAFEAVSAVSNSGLSLTPHGGLAADMTTMGRWVLIGLMLLGRVGPLMLLAGVATRREE